MFCGQRPGVAREAGSRAVSALPARARRERMWRASVERMRFLSSPASRRRKQRPQHPNAPLQLMCLNSH